jgi:hypothetical protein
MFAAGKKHSITIANVRLEALKGLARKTIVLWDVTSYTLLN